MLPKHLACVAQSKGPWLFAEVVPNFEKALAANLYDRGLDFYLPLTVTRRKVQRSRMSPHGFFRDYILPLFPGYIFLSTGAEEYCLDAPARESHIFQGGIHRIVNQRRIVRELSSLEIALFADPRLRIEPVSRIGQHVRVKFGPFEGVEGYVERFKETREICKCVLNIGTLGGVPLTIDKDNLEAIPEPTDVAD